jgi:hypothetical protein
MPPTVEAPTEVTSIPSGEVLVKVVARQDPPPKMAVEKIAARINVKGLIALSSLIIVKENCNLI